MDLTGTSQGVRGLLHAIGPTRNRGRCLLVIPALIRLERNKALESYRRRRHSYENRNSDKDPRAAGHWPKVL
jgi:hypothetical protein